MRSLSRLLLVFAVVASPAMAFAADPAAARAQLEVGYGLKEQGKYQEALPHFLESLRLDPQLKTLTNLADCEDHLGQLVDAQQHWVMARDRAGAEGNDRLKASAEARLVALESRMPRLTIKVAPDAPAGTEVVRDGTVLGAISLGAPLPTNTGAHTVVARAPGFAEESFSVTLQEAEQKELVVRPGALLPPVAPVIATASLPTSDAVPGYTAGWTSRKTGAVVAGGVAVVSAGLGIAFGLSTGSSWSAAQHDCGKGCSSTSEAASERSTALTDATVSDITFALAGVALASAAVLWFTAPKHHEAPRPLDALRVVPAVGMGGGGLSVLGQF
jgi:hypothetical protein